MSGGYVEKDFPKSVETIRALTEAALETLHDLDYHMSGDSEISDEEMQRRIRRRLGKVFLRQS